MLDAVVDVLDVVTLTEPSEYKLDVSHCKPLANSGKVTFENVPVILSALIRLKRSRDLPRDFGRSYYLTSLFRKWSTFSSLILSTAFIEEGLASLGVLVGVSMACGL